MADHIFTGFGFGPIQSGLFAKEAFESGNFSRIVVAEIDQELVDAVRANSGSYFVNVATSDGVEVLKVDGVELLNPNIDSDREALIEILHESTEVATSLPSVNFYDIGGDKSIASLLAEGLGDSSARATIIYAAENNNHAAEILSDAVSRKMDPQISERVQFLNTVIGKMSQVVTDRSMIEELGLKPIAPGIERAFLVEEFNRILVSRTGLEGFRPGIEVFVEKDDLLPFEEAKLYGHNAIHALLAFIGALKGYRNMTELEGDQAVMRVGRDAFIEESGGALIHKYANLGDELFKEVGYKDYAEDLLRRMTNPYLADSVARASRDVVRKLGPDDRIFGTMRLALEYGIEPKNMAIGALAGIALLLAQAEQYELPNELRQMAWRDLGQNEVEVILNWLWIQKPCADAHELAGIVCQATGGLSELLG